MLKSKILFLIIVIIKNINLNTTENLPIININDNYNYNSYNIKEINNYISYLNIPKINLYKGLIDINSIDNYVDKNIQIINSSNMPDVINSNLILAAHSGNSNVSFFKDLDKLNIDDNIYIEYDNKNYEYKITNYYIVEKTGYIDIIRNENTNILTLITCIENTNKQIVFICEINKITDL